MNRKSPRSTQIRPRPTRSAPALPAILQGLNEPQQQAVLSTDGPLLIVAGPGSGKTRVITHRIAYLVEECGVAPWRILAVTFTNKAAREMRERLDRLMLGSGEAVTMGTFHAVCARILRRHGERVGLDRNFTIYDQDDQTDAIKSAMQLADIDPRSYNPRALLSRISAAKSSLHDSRQMAQTAYDADDEYGAHWVDVCARVYRYYEEALTRQNALDFDDLLMRTAQLLETSPEVQAQYHDRYRYLLIDEFQDTNVAQYRLARLLARHEPIRTSASSATPTRAIYSWRNADIRNILSFQSDFPNATVISLGENYRSTKNILNAADNVIAAQPPSASSGSFSPTTPPATPSPCTRPTARRTRPPGPSTRCPASPGPTSSAPATAPSCTASTPRAAPSKTSACARASPTAWSAASVSTTARRSRT